MNKQERIFGELRIIPNYKDYKPELAEEVTEWEVYYRTRCKGAFHYDFVKYLNKEDWAWYQTQGVRLTRKQFKLIDKIYLRLKKLSSQSK